MQSEIRQLTASLETTRKLLQTQAYTLRQQVALNVALTIKNTQILKQLAERNSEIERLRARIAELEQQQAS